MTVTKLIQCDTEEIEKTANEIEAISKEFHWNIERLKQYGIRVIYHCETSELDKKIENLIGDSIKIVDAG